MLNDCKLIINLANHCNVPPFVVWEESLMLLRKASFRMSGPDSLNSTHDLPSVGDECRDRIKCGNTETFCTAENDKKNTYNFNREYSEIAFILLGNLL